jgi:hypothetical protein
MHFVDAAVSMALVQAEASADAIAFADGGAGGRKMASRDDIAQLRTLAAEKGYRLEPAVMGGCWRLMDDVTGTPATSENGSAGFTVAEAIRFLRLRAVTAMRSA